MSPEKITNPDMSNHYRSLQPALLGIENSTYDLLPKFPGIENKDIGRIMRLVFDNDRMAQLLESPIFKSVLAREKEMKGDCKTGVIQCIDGRNSILDQFGRTLNIWETPGSKIKTKEEEGKLYVDSKRLTSVLNSTAKEERELLEIVTTHTSLKHRNHLCGAMTAQAGNNATDKQIDKLALYEASNTAQAIENTYNRILKRSEKSEQNQVAITATIDNDTMGLILGYMTDDQISTTQIMQSGLYLKIKESLPNVAGDFGSMRNYFNDQTHFLEYAVRVANITEWLTGYEINEASSFINEVRQYIDRNFGKLTDGQKKALMFTMARTMAVQYVTGLSSSDNEDHPYSQHDEKCLVVAPSKAFGRHLRYQTFSSTPSNRDDVVNDVKMKLSIMDKKNSGKPEILFVSVAMNKETYEQRSGKMSDEYGSAIDWPAAYYRKLFEDGEIRERVENGKLLIIPLIVDSESGKVIDFVDLRDYVDKSNLT